MCGVGGILSLDRKPVARERLQAMSERLEHRGPDGAGIWTEGPLGLVHRRLAVLDLSDRSAQPFTDGLSALSFNGEIYNYHELRQELRSRGEEFTTSGDVEVLFKGLRREGTDFLAKVNGDFAFAFWHGPSQKLILARDRFGVKPLYYIQTPGEILFASEIRALRAAGVPFAVNHEALFEYLKYRYCEADHTLFAGIYRVTPGTCLEIQNGRISKKTYWQLNARRHSYASYGEGLEHMSELLCRSVRLRSRADVPVGILLSGGIDSTAIAYALAPNAASVSAYTYAVPGRLSEAHAGRFTAQRLQLTHHTLEHDEARAYELPAAIRALEEPVGDSIIGPVYSLFRACGRNMKVVLSGEGADEILGGYVHQQSLKKKIRLEEKGLAPLLRWGAGALARVPSPWLARLINYPAAFDGRLQRRAAEFLRAGDVGAGHELSRSLWLDHEVMALMNPDIAITHQPSAPEPLLDWEAVLARDISTWLPNYGMLRTDKLSMAHGVECRVPYLQHELAEAALSLTLQHASRLRHPVKRALRDVMRTHLKIDPMVARRKKQPFFLADGISRGLRDLIGEYLSPKAVRTAGLLDEARVREILSRPAGFLNEKQITSLLHLQIWWHEQNAAV